MYEHLLVALDGSQAAEAVLEHAEALARAFGSTLTLLRATVTADAVMAQPATGGPFDNVVGPMLDPMPILQADQDDALGYLNAVAARFKQHNLAVNIEHFEGPPADTIVERARALGASLILMTTHGRSGFGRAVFGSVADAVLRHASCPVLLVRLSGDEA
ncbi:MAG: universal stress protein [Chloroflexota bacterium]